MTTTARRIESMAAAPKKIIATHDPTPSAPLAAPAGPLVNVAVPWRRTSVWHYQRLDMHLEQRQGTALRFALAELQERQARLKDGHLVTSGSDVVRFMLEQLADGIGLDATGKIPGAV